MKLFRVYVEGEDSSNFATMIIRADNKGRALDAAEEVCADYPEFKGENTTYDACVLAQEGEEEILWMS